MTFDFKTLYFAVISVVSVLVVGFGLLDLIQTTIIFLFPDLVAGDLARLDKIYEGDPAKVQASLMYEDIQPFASQFISQILHVLLFGALLAWHLPRLLGSK